MLPKLEILRSQAYDSVCNGWLSGNYLTSNCWKPAFDVHSSWTPADSFGAFGILPKHFAYQ